MGVLGYCTECKALKPIQPAGLKLGSRECEWRPAMHDKLVHVGCDALVILGAFTCSKCGPVDAGHECQAVLDGFAHVERDDDAHRCTRCGDVLADAVTRTRCFGDRKDIR